MNHRPVSIFHDLSFHTQRLKQYTEQFSMDTDIASMEDSNNKVKDEEDIIKSLLFDAWINGLLQPREFSNEGR